MTIQQATNIIEQNLSYYINPVPKRLMNKIKRIISETKTVAVKSTVQYIKPDLEAEWLKLCGDYKVNPIVAKRGKNHIYISIRCHFIRYILTEYSRSVVSLNDLGSFLGRNHNMIIYYRDYSKINCVLPPLGLSNWKRFNYKSYILKEAQNKG